MKGRFSKMKKMVSVMFALMMLVGLMVPVMSNAENPNGHKMMYVVNSDGRSLNVHENPSNDSAILYRAENGSKLRIGEPAADGWVMVRQGDKACGYVMTKYLQAKKPGKYDLTERKDEIKAVNPFTVTAKARGRKTAESVGLRTLPTKKSASIRRLYAGDRLEVFAVGKTWSMVLDPKTGLTGYVANDYMIR